jgi:hypothetical protein
MLKEIGMAKTEKKVIKEPFEQVSIQLNTKLLKKIDARAKKLDLSRSQLLRNYIEIGHGDADILDALGLLTVASIGKKIVNKLKIGLSSGKYTINDEGDIDVKKEE